MDVYKYPEHQKSKQSVTPSMPSSLKNKPLT